MVSHSGPEEEDPNIRNAARTVHDPLQQCSRSMEMTKAAKRILVGCRDLACPDDPYLSPQALLNGT